MKTQKAGGPATSRNYFKKLYFIHVSIGGYTLYPKTSQNLNQDDKSLAMERQVKIQNILKAKFSELQARNSSYSLRAFSKKVGVSPGTLSLVMLGKRKVSLQLAHKIADNLMLDPQESSEFLHASSTTRNYSKLGENYLQLRSDQFEVISEWYYFAILNLFNTCDFQSEIPWISKRLGIPIKKVSLAIDRLERLGLIKYGPEGQMLRSQPKLRTSDDIKSVALRKSHHETLKLAHDSLDTDSLSERDFTWITLAFDKNKMKEAKILIRKFEDEFMELMENDSKPTEVYRMAVQLFPLTRNGENK